eukprot:CAMPEP_0183306858 /NCGR_PEP_ID=MMETSP0160_2-20130417/15025_1 /TAXON_ID=2839 ORGANISM="Odontella Sinensis, Strain Grunow 1884" /NCGR_SAMPLE_ID=MMETSP0160_2 /ASSEMBLY_ACC=CAM_ASM_000250 /LENGTH=110 /DNA_ID=CAMNT_0025470327 /DNA_START=90 /DNA_END=421 /DNA_ORIENTATION=-
MTDWDQFPPLPLSSSSPTAWAFSPQRLAAWTGPPVAISSDRTEFTIRCRARGVLAESNDLETTTTLKCDSDPGGTLCMWLSLRTSRWSGAKASVSFAVISFATGVEELLI